MSVQSIFDLTYVAFLDPRRAALFAGSLGLPGTALDPATRQATALALAQSGLVIDGWIDAAGADPYFTMLWRKNNGYTWYPSILQPGVATTVKGAIVPGYATYDPSNPPPGSILVSTNLSDYPPFAVAPPVIIPPETTLFGVFIAPGMYFASETAIQLATAGAIKAGQQEVNPSDGLTYTFIVSANPMGNSYYWKAD